MLFRLLIKLLVVVENTLSLATEIAVNADMWVQISIYTPKLRVPCLVPQCNVSSVYAEVTKSSMEGNKKGSFVHVS